MYKKYTICDRLQQILEAIDIIEERCKDIHCADEFLLTPGGMMIFDSCVMRLQAIGEQVGKLLKEPEAPSAVMKPSLGEPFTTCEILFRTNI